jgi:hypothetical protein
MSDRRLLLKAIILLGLMLAADCTCAEERERINTIAGLMGPAAGQGGDPV